MRLAAATCALVTAFSAFGQVNVLSGRYATVSESEWEMRIDLRSDDSATLEIASWEPGGADKPKVKRYRGSWSVTRADVSIKFKEGTATFRFEPQLSFAEFGRKGAAPGLVGKSASFERSTIVRRSLWLEADLKRLKW